jgi:hypothetical protein
MLPGCFRDSLQRLWSENEVDYRRQILDLLPRSEGLTLLDLA